MSISKLALSCLFGGALLVGVPALFADEGHDHGKPGHANHDHGKHDQDHAKDAVTPGPSLSSHDGMTALYRHLGEMEKELAAGSLEGLHGHDEAIQAAVKDLDKDTSLTAPKRKRVQGYVKNVIKLSGKLHASADAKKLDQAKKDIVKLSAQVDLLDKQFAHSHKPVAGNSGKEGDAHSH